MDVSDGIGYATAIIPKEILDELWTYGNQIQNHCIICMRGRVIRSSYEDGKTAFIFNEAPRAVIVDVREKTVIGEPMPLIRAFDLQKYDDIKNKYPPNYFKIQYRQKFKAVMQEGNHIPRTVLEHALLLRDKVSRRSTAPEGFSLHTFGTELTMVILSFAYKYHKVKLLLKRLNVDGFLTATSPQFPSICKIPKKCVDLPIFSNNSIVIRTSNANDKGSPVYDIDKFYKVNEKINNLEGEYHQDIIGLRSLYSIKNLDKLKNLEMLIMPYAFNPINNE